MMTKKRKKNFVSKLIYLFGIFLLMANAYGKEISGVIVDADDKTPLPGANILLQGTRIGTITGLDGSFYLTIPDETKEIFVSFVGYLSKTVPVGSGANIDLGKIELKTDAVGLAEIYVTASIAVDRKTPIAVSNIKVEHIETKLGSQEFPEILKSTPGIYATKRGGGFGDAEVRIRGFSSTNIAVLINGMPVNGMEDDKTYWSNWAGLSDVTRTMQVQRGVGASKIAVPSVGGTINVITNTTDAERGGNVSYTVGNDNYEKIGATVSTGLTENNWAATFRFSKVSGDGYVEGTPFTGYSYFFNLSKRVNDYHRLALTVFGAPQEHAKRYTHQPIDVLEEQNDGHRYNSDWGYKNGQFYSNSTNFYHKPVAMLNHYWSINPTTSLTNTVYASLGIGGGGYCTEDEIDIELDSEGQIDWDKAVAANEERSSNGEAAGVYFQNSFNYHSWVGALSMLKKTKGDLDFLVGLDYRYYYGKHWQQADDLLGANTVKDTRNVDAVYYYNNEVMEGEKIYYDNDGEVMWEGLFLQTEYSKGNISAFASATISNRSYRRYDFAQYFSDDLKSELKNDGDLQDEWEKKLAEYMDNHDYTSILESDAYTVNQHTEWQHFMGYTFKTGLNYNLSNKQHVFVNGGYIERQPIFSTVFQNYKNLINNSAVNEKVITGEVGYGYRSRFFTADLNLYYTKWMDRTTTGNVDDPDDPNEVLFYNIEGVDARHAGIEFNFVATPFAKLNIAGMVSLGDWIWANNVDSAKVFKDQTLVEVIDALYLKDVHVADAAQTTAALGFNYEVLSGLRFGIDMNYYDRLYADFDVDSRTSPDDAGVDVEQVPDYFMMDANMFYNFEIGSFNASFYANMFNVLNTVCITDAEEGSGYYYSYGRTWTCGLKVRF